MTAEEIAISEMPKAVVDDRLDRISARPHTFVKEYSPSQEDLEAVIMELSRALEALAAELALSDEELERKIAERDQAEEANRRLAAIVHSSEDAIVGKTLDGIITNWNEAAARMYGYSAEEAVGKPFTIVVPEDRREEESRLRQIIKRGEQVERFETLQIRKDGSLLPVSMRVSQVYDTEGALIGMSVIARDITARKKVEKALLESERRFRSLFEASPDAIIVEDLEGNVLDVNPAACRLHNADRTTLIGTNLRDLVPPEQRDAAVRDFEKLVGGEVSYLQTNSWTFDRRPVPVEMRINRLFYNGGEALMIIVRDISERHRLEREILRISEEERQRIGRDIHDELASQFSGIALLARGLVNQWRQERSVNTEMLEQVAQLARTGAEQARAVARGLAPVKLEQESFEAAMKELAHDVELRSDLSCSFESDASLPAVSGVLAVQLYRIAQEAAGNAAKHARAAHLAIRLFRRANRLVLAIQDDGQGLPDNTETSEGMGLHIMPYRAGMIGATYSIKSTPGEGTTVTCSLSLEEVALV